MNRPVRLGVSLHPEHTSTAAMLAAARQAEEKGADVLFTWDHFYPLSGDPDGTHFECWTVLAAMAEATERVELGPLVACNSYRNPNLHADMARTVDHISGGRVIFGIGSGWKERDYDEYGYEFGTAGSRLRKLKADLPLIRERWGKLNPLPTRDLPILIGGGGEKVTLKLVAEHASIWHYFGTPETMAPKLEILRGHCADVGRDYDDIEKSVGIDWEKVTDIEGTANAFYDLGFRQFTFGVNGPDFDIGFVKDWLNWRDSK